MLNLIQTEFLKLRRRKFILLMLLPALFMPFIAIFYVRHDGKTGIEAIQFYKWSALSYTPWIILPVVLGVISTMLMYDEHQNDMLKQLRIVPVGKAGYFFSKFIIVLIYSVCFMLLTAAASIFFGLLHGQISFDWRSIAYLLRKCMEIAVLTAFSVMPVLAVAAAVKGYILPVCVTLVYTFFGFILITVNMYLHPLSASTAVIMRDIPGAVMKQALNIPTAFLCIGIWSMSAALVTVSALGKTK